MHTGIQIMPYKEMKSDRFKTGTFRSKINQVVNRNLLILVRVFQTQDRFCTDKYIL
jgi:hypothetical protein